MKFKFFNGHSIHLWDSEYNKVVIAGGKITCTRPGGKVAVIEVPKEWFERISSKIETPPPQVSCHKGASIGSSKKEEHSQRAINDPSPITPYCGAEKKKVIEELEAQYKQLSSQVEALKQGLSKLNDPKKKLEDVESRDSISGKLAADVMADVEALRREIAKLNVDIKQRFDPLLELPTKVRDTSHYLENCWSAVSDLQRGLNDVKKEVWGMSGTQPQRELEWSQANGPQKRKKDSIYEKKKG